VIGNKISSFFLVLVLLLSVTNLPTFSTTQLNSDSHNLNGLSINLIGVAFADDDDDDEVEDDDDDNGKDKKEKKDKKENKGHKGGKQEIKVEIEDGKAEVEIKINGIESELELDTNDLDEILTLIQTITGLSESEIKDIWEIEIEENGDDGDHGKKDKIAICHIPPGNPDNAHTISVSGNAKNAHLAHGDTLGECPDGDDGNQDDEGQDNTTTITLTKQVTSDNQGTAGPDDFKISVNGTIVLSGSTTEVAPNVLFAINETAADGYEFVEITGDPECPTNLDEKTISLAAGQDINCIIHNNDEGNATPDNEELSQLIDENKKLKEDIVRQEEQIDVLNEQIDYLSELIASIQGFFGSIFG